MTDPAPVFVLAVDGGATGTRARVADAAGGTLGEGVAGPSSLTLGPAAAVRSVRAALAAAGAEAGLPNLAAAGACVLALAGALHRGNRQAFLDADPLGRPVNLVSDGHAALVGALGGRPGAVVSVGTGVAGERLYPDGATATVDGWGFPVGDDGSGAWIGLEAVRLYLRSRDRRQHATGPLIDALAGRLGKSVEDIQAWTVGARSTDFAALAPVAVEAAAMGDPLAETILEGAAEAVGRAFAALDGDRPAERLSLLGGLAPVMAPRLPPELRDRLVAPAGSALDGAVRLALAAVPRRG